MMQPSGTLNVSEIPVSIYIHVPWCVKKCPYCDFNSHAVAGGIPESQYVDTLIQDFDQDLPYFQQRPIQSIFIGGGTPSLFSAESYQRLLSHIASKVTFSNSFEVTMEVNPGTLEYRDMAAYREVGINRISVGVQSFGQDQLQSLGRIHTASEAEVAIGRIYDAGFDSFNIDLMFGLPAQRLGDALADLNRALRLKPCHISWYELTIEKNTEFYNRPPVLPHEDEVFEIWQAGQRLLQQNGFEQYEVSAYAKSGYASKHNINYWLFGDYVGIGAGAHGKISRREGAILRTKKTRLPRDYMKAVPMAAHASSELIPSRNLTIEFMMNALRLVHGFDIHQFVQRTGLSYEHIEPVIEKAINRGWLKQETSQIACTPSGYSLLNEVLALF